MKERMGHKDFENTSLDKMEGMSYIEKFEVMMQRKK
jgi:hypothetical protein